MLREQIDSYAGHGDVGRPAAPQQEHPARWTTCSKLSGAERHSDQVGWAIAVNAWRFTALSDDVL